MNGNNNEPYIGMPINLDDIDMEMINMPNDPMCITESDFADWPIAMAYVPMQRWEEPYDPEQALDAGTMFASLDKPFRGWMTR